VKALSSLLITLLTLDKDDLDKNQTPLSTSRFLEVSIGIYFLPFYVISKMIVQIACSHPKLRWVLFFAVTQTPSITLIPLHR
jgi:hypothetical protein